MFKRICLTIALAKIVMTQGTKKSVDTECDGFS